MASEDTSTAVQSSKGFYLAQKEIKGVENPPQPRTSRVGPCACKVTGSVGDVPHAADCDQMLRALTSIPHHSLSVEIDSL